MCDDVVHRDRLRDLEVEGGGLELRFLDDPADVRGEVALLELARRDVDGDAHRRRPPRLPLPELLAGPPEDPFADARDEPDVLGERDELARREDPLLGMAPADERLDADDRAVAQPSGSAGSAGRTRLGEAPACRPDSSAARSWDCSCIFRVKNWKLLRPVSLARYIAVSTFVTSVSASAPSAGYIPMPMDASTKSSRFWIRNGSARIARILRAIPAASASRVIPLRRRRNSSPPTRATVSSWRMQRRSRSATLTRSSSPAEWPRVSFTRLKWSRSRNMTTSACLRRCAWRIASERRSLKRTRFGRSVRASWFAWCQRCCSARLRSVMSIRLPSMTVSPPGSSMRLSFARTQTGLPSRRLRQISKFTRTRCWARRERNDSRSPGSE